MALSAIGMPPLRCQLDVSPGSRINRLRTAGSRKSERLSKDRAHARVGRPASALAEGRETPAYLAQCGRDQVVSVGASTSSQAGTRSAATLATARRGKAGAQRA